MDLAVKENDLVIATHGRSFRVLDEIGLLRDWTPEVSRSAIHLFPPRPAIRGLRAASVDFLLARTPSSGAVEILAPDGSLVRRFECTAALCRAGTNRISWNLQYPGPATFPGIVLRYASPREGPVAPPGTYQVRLTADGQSETRPLAVLRNPRVSGVSAADLERQFQLALQLRNAESQANQMVVQIRAIKQQIRDRNLAAGGALAARLSEIEETLYQVRNRSPRDTLNYPIRLNNQLAVLQRLVGMGDDPPTAQQEAVTRELIERLGQLRDTFETAVAVDLKKLNERLAADRLEPVK